MSALLKIMFLLTFAAFENSRPVEVEMPGIELEKIEAEQKLMELEVEQAQAEQAVREALEQLQEQGVEAE